MSRNPTDKFCFTVGQLAELLKTFPPDLPVVVSGYESGYENFHRPSILKMKHEPENMYFDGEFQPAKDGDPGTFNVVVLTRVLRDD